MKVRKFNSSVPCTEQQKTIQSCTQALSADVCQSVLHEAPLWAGMLLVHYGWGAILRHGTRCIFIFWEEGDDTWLLPNPFMRCVYSTWWIQTHWYRVCSSTDLILVWSVQGKRKEEARRLGATEVTESVTRQHFIRNLLHAGMNRIYTLHNLGLIVRWAVTFTQRLC